MRRREVVAVALLGLGASAAAAKAALAQSPAKVARLGYIWLGARGSERSTLDGLRQGLRELGWAEGRDFVVEARYADSRAERLPALVSELVGLNVALMLAPGNQITAAAMSGTSTIPILSTAPDLLAAGFVGSLARPGGNVTGISLTAGGALGGKWLEILKEAFPDARRVALLWNSGSAYVENIRNAAAALDLHLREFRARDPDGLNAALAAIERDHVDALVVESDPNLISHRARIIGFAAAHRLPAVYGNQDYIQDGGLIAYATSIHATWRRLATYVDKILKGAAPAELPVEQASKFELLINLRTARTLGLRIPQSLLARADEVIE